MNEQLCAACNHAAKHHTDWRAANDPMWEMYAIGACEGPPGCYFEIPAPEYDVGPYIGHFSICTCRGFVVKDEWAFPERPVIQETA